MKSASSPVARALLVVSLCLAAARAAAFSTEPYAPFPDGATWTYSVSDGTSVSTAVTTVVGSRTFNGAVVKIIRDQDGNENYLTNDAAGVRFHGGFFLNVDPICGNETDTFVPPLPFAAREASIGTLVSATGAVTAETTGCGPVTVAYNSVSDPRGFETVAVPAGTFTNALHLRVTLEFPEFAYSETLDFWLVPGIGSVKEIAFDSFTGVTTTSELVSYSIPVRRTLADFNGDARSDILWRNVSSGENYLYPMNGTAILATEGSVRTVADQNWQVAGIGDFDGDGKADILWRNLSTGENYLYFMDGTAIKATEGYIRTLPDQSWRVAGVGDFDGDGKDDILWRNAANGENYLYLMDGKTIKPTEGNIRAVADPNWRIVGVGDFDGNGKADILWRNSSSGENYIYLMSGTSIAGEGFLRTVADPNWTVAGAGDFDGDGKADIVWRNGSSGENYLYPMDGTAIKPSEGYLRTVPDPAWRIVGVRDFDGDGKADVFWRHSSSGENYLYPMDGTSIKPSEGYVRTVPDQNWKPQ